MITIHLYNENCANAGRRAAFPSGDTFTLTFDDAEEALNYAAGLRSARVGAGRDLFNLRCAAAIEAAAE